MTEFDHDLDSDTFQPDSTTAAEGAVGAELNEPVATGDRVDYEARRVQRRQERKAQQRADRLGRLIPHRPENTSTDLRDPSALVAGSDDLRSTARRWGGSQIALVAVVAVVAVAGVGLGLDYGLNAGKVHRGVSVLGVNLGGVSQAQAAEKIATHFQTSLDNEIVLSYDGSEWTVTGSQLGVSYNAQKMAADAYSVGRSGSLLAQVRDRFHAVVSGEEIAVESSVDEEASTAFLSEVTAQTDIAPVDSSVRLASGNFVATEGSDGRAAQIDQLLSALPIALARGQQRYEIPVAVAPMAITLPEARAAADLATTLATSKMSVNYESDQWSFTAAQVGSLFTFVRSDSADPTKAALVSMPVAKGEVALVPAVSVAKVTSVILKEIGTKVGTAPVNATFKTGGGAVSVVPGKSGVGADPAKLATDIATALHSDISPKVVTLVTTSVEPEVTTAEAKAMGIVERISTYTTTFSSGNAPRVNNIKTLAAALDGTLLAPGATFSFNGTVGERTAAKGYMEAGAIVNGELVQQLGGGICQVNTTLFNAVLLSGLPINQRHNHSYYIDHYPLGRDATVSWGGPDFKFTNDLDTWVLISTAASSGSVTISLYGTDPGYDVSLKTSGWSNVRKFKTKEVEDPTLTVGRRVVETAGINGGNVTLSRSVTKGGAAVRTDSFPSSYTTVTEVVRVGTKPKSTTVTPTPVTPTP